MQRAPVARVLQLQFIHNSDMVQEPELDPSSEGDDNLSVNVLGMPPNVTKTFTPQSSSSILSRAFIRRVGFTLPRQLHEFTTQIEGRQYSLRDFCTLENLESNVTNDGGAPNEDAISSSKRWVNRCLMYHVGSLWDHNETDFLRDNTLSRVRQRAAVTHPGMAHLPVGWDIRSAGAARGFVTPLATSVTGAGTLPKVLFREGTTATGSSPFVADSDNDELHVPRAMLVRNLRNLHSCAKSGHLVADSAMFLLALNVPQSYHEEVLEGEFFKQLWEAVLPEIGETSSYGYNGQSVQFTYLRYRKTVSSAAEKVCVACYPRFIPETIIYFSFVYIDIALFVCN